ncbi:MAG: PCRF domain-containing protein, partial [Planctomycetaceae bacterium]
MAGLREELETKLARFESLERDLQDPAVQSDAHRMAATAREHGSLAKLANKYRQFAEAQRRINDNEDLAACGDSELKELAEAELPSLRAERERLWDELLEMSGDDEDAARTRCIMELRAGTGGDEAALFVRDLFEMYRRYALAEGWNVEILDASPTELGGFKELVLGIAGENVFRRLRHESGGHRVQ